jgi:hypothetical protein
VTCLGLWGLTGCGNVCGDDGDGFGDPTMCQPDPFPGSVPNGDDCADDNPNAFPGSAENESDTLCMEDADGDGWGDDMPPEGVEPGTDCNDDNMGIFPDAAENEGGMGCEQDADGDGYGDSMPDDPDVPPGTDCDDGDVNTFPGAAPNDSPDACMTDADMDDWGDDMPSSPDAEPGTDCDDSNMSVFPGAAENESDTACMQDADGDGWGDSTPDNPEVDPGQDCDDSSENTFPGAAPNDSPEACMRDEDGDDYGDDMPPEGVTPGTDCNDMDARVQVDCPACMPNESACVGDELHVCDDQGMDMVTQCEFGCDDQGKKCWDQMSVDAGDSLCIDMGAQAQLNATVMGGDGMYTYAWSPAMTLDDPAIPNPLATPVGPTTYTVDVSDGEGNMASDSVTVYLKNQTLQLDPQICTTMDFTGPGETDPNTNWVWNDQTKQLCQTINGKASALFCGWELNNATITGTFSVNTIEDDDWTGFMWGIQDSNHYYLFTWKQITQNFANCGGMLPAGMQVKVIDVADPMANPQTCADRMQPADTVNSKLLVPVAEFTTQGWQDLIEYTFELTHKANGEMTIVVRNKLTMQVVAMKTFMDTTYASGKFGMFTKSQISACFSNFTASCIEP